MGGIHSCSLPTDPPLPRAARAPSRERGAVSVRARFALPSDKDGGWPMQPVFAREHARLQLLRTFFDSAPQQVCNSQLLGSLSLSFSLSLSPLSLSHLCALLRRRNCGSQAQSQSHTAASHPLRAVWAATYTERVNELQHTLSADCVDSAIVAMLAVPTVAPVCNARALRAGQLPLRDVLAAVLRDQEETTHGLNTRWLTADELRLRLQCYEIANAALMCAAERNE